LPHFLCPAGQHAKEFLIEDGYLDEVGEAKRQSALRQQKDESVEEIRINSTNAYVTPDDPPAFLCVGELDKKFRVEQMKRLAAKCEKVGLEHRFIIQKGMDHMYIPDPEVIREIFSFFDKYVKTKPADVENQRTDTDRNQSNMSTEDLLKLTPDGVTVLPDIAYREGN